MFTIVQLQLYRKGTQLFGMYCDAMLKRIWYIILAATKEP